MYSLNHILCILELCLLQIELGREFLSVYDETVEVLPMCFSAVESVLLS